VNPPPAPLRDNRLRARADLQRAALSLWNPVAARLTPGRTRARLGATAAHFPTRDADLEAFARPLWGLVPLVAGGGVGVDWADLRTGLANGTDLGHSEYWGDACDFSHKFVEMPSLAVALVLAPREMWDPLPGRAKEHIVRWLDQINEFRIYENNWLFFRVLVNTALATITGSARTHLVSDDLDKLDSMYLGGGWYTDMRRRDYYNAFAFHFYSLVFSAVAAERQQERGAVFRARAEEFASHFVHWFDREGAPIPFGRSLTYRFALGAFWGALAFANVEALPWGQTKGLALRHLRWWLRQPILDNGGILSLGFSYPNLNLIEAYSGPASPYWAFKAFLPLAVPETHPFWQTTEEDYPAVASIDIQAPAGIVACRDDRQRHTFVLCSGQEAGSIRHGAAKYGKFAYSSSFGFSIPSGDIGLAQGAFDSTLALSDDGQRFRARADCVDGSVQGVIVFSRWIPWPDVEVETWLMALPPWHLRVHRIQTKRQLWSSDGGFSVPRADEMETIDATDNGAMAATPAGWCGIVNLQPSRTPFVEQPDPNTNVLHPRTLLPSLGGAHDPGTHWLACAVVAGHGEYEDVWSQRWQMSFRCNERCFELTTPLGWYTHWFAASG
jgi:hypothetical protein